MSLNFLGILFRHGYFRRPCFQIIEGCAPHRIFFISVLLDTILILTKHVIFPYRVFNSVSKKEEGEVEGHILRCYCIKRKTKHRLKGRERKMIEMLDGLKDGRKDGRVLKKSALYVEDVSLSTDSFTDGIFPIFCYFTS